LKNQFIFKIELKTKLRVLLHFKEVQVLYVHKHNFIKKEYKLGLTF
jgi:hypothetical protein